MTHNLNNKLSQDLDTASSTNTVITETTSLIYNWDQIKIDANAAKKRQHEMTVSEAIKYHKSAIFWGAVMSLTIVMEGYDSTLMTSFFGYPSFQKKYGVEIRPGVYELEGIWQIALGCAAQIGLITGVVANGYLCERFGHRKVIMVSLVLMSLFISITVFAPNVQALFIGQILCGLPWGIFTTMGPTYSSEIAPLVLRGYFTAYVNICWAIGQLIAAGVLANMVNNNTELGFRLPFMFQWIWPIPLFILTYLAPDSPWWLVRKGRNKDALESIKTLSDKSTHQHAPEHLAMIVYTTHMEQHKETDSKKWTYHECFTGVNLRRTEIASITFVGQTLTGAAFAYSPSYFLRQVGMNPLQVYRINVGITMVALTGTISSWMLLARYGRRSIYVIGSTILCVCLLIVGLLQIPVNYIPGLVKVQLLFVTIWVAVYSSTVGPLTYTIVSEISASRLRPQTVAIARTCYNIAQIGCAIIEPLLLNPGEFDLKGYTALVWSATSGIVLIWAFFRLPETKDRTYDELNRLFDNKVPARHFSAHQLEPDD